MNRISRWGAVAVTLAMIITAGAFVRRAHAQTVQNAALTAPKDPSPLYVITFCDITPNYASDGTELLKRYAAATKKEPGIVRSELLAQSNRTNHFVILQVWQNTAEFDKHQEAQSTKDFRAKLQPMLGAPLDERPHFQVE